MKMVMFLLLSVVALLVNPAVSNPTPHKRAGTLQGNAIIDLAEIYNKTLNEQMFVENLWDIGCEDKFFCKAHDVLHAHERFGKSHTEKEIVRNLKSFTVGRNANCTELLEGVTPSGKTVQVPRLLDNVVHCIRERNFSGN